MLVTLSGQHDLITGAELDGMAQAARAMIARGLTSAIGGVDDRLLTLLPGLKEIISVGAGREMFDVPTLEARGIALRTTPDVMTLDVADCAVGLIFSLLRNIPANDLFVRRGDWERGRPAPGRRISGCRVGVVGLGRIGSRIAGILSGLGCVLAYNGRSPQSVDWRFEPDVAALAASVDVLVLSCAGGDATRHLIDSRVLAALGRDGYLVNVARGSVVDESALLTALETGAIAGAALDVFRNEPGLDPRFMALQYCILQPHSAVLTRENRLDLAAELTRLLNQSV